MATVGPPGKLSVPLPMSNRHPVSWRKSSPKMQQSCTSATHTRWRILLPPTHNHSSPFPIMGASWPVAVRSCTAVGCKGVPLGRTSGLTSVTDDPVSTRPAVGTPWTETATWQELVTPELPRIHPTTTGGAPLSSASGGAPSPWLCCRAPPDGRQARTGAVGVAVEEGVRISPSMRTPRSFPAPGEQQGSSF